MRLRPIAPSESIFEMLASAASPLRPPSWLAGVVLVMTALVFLPTLSGGFLGDDFVYIARFHALAWSEWPALFFRDWSGGVWGSPLHELRPFAALSFMSDARLFGDYAPGYRLTNLLLHLVATFLLVRLAWRYSAGNAAATLVAGLVFGLHPAHAEAVTWITGRVDLLATAAALVFWFGAESYSDHGRPRCAATTLAAFFVGIFAKELCMFAPLLLLLHWLLLGWPADRAVWRRRALLLFGTVVLLTGYAYCRSAAFGHDSIGYNIWTDEPAWRRQAAHFGWLLPLLPFTGQQEWSAPLTTSVLHGLWLTLLAVTVIGLAFARWRHARLTGSILFFGGLWLFVTVFPLAGVVYFSPRHLYFPTVGLALAAGLVTAAVKPRGLKFFIGTACVAWCGAGLFAATQPWISAARVSREALSALDRELAGASPGAFVFTAVPETFGPVWLWAWSSPACVGAPFLQHPVPATQVVERPVNYARSDHWLADRKPAETARAAFEAVALFVDAANHAHCRRVSGAELAAKAARLPATPSVEDWTRFVHSLVQP